MYQENKDMGYGQNVGQEAQQSTYMQYTHSKVLVRKDGTSGEQGTYLETSGTIIKHICWVNPRITQSSK